MRELFNSYDLDNSQHIDSYEIVELLKKLGLEITDKQAKSMIKDVDTNANDELEFEEFRALVKKIESGDYGFIKRDFAKVVDKSLVMSTTLTP